MKNFISIIIFFFAVSLTGGQQQQSSLIELLPDRPTVLKPKGDNMVVTCLGKASNVTDFRWLNPKNATIIGLPVGPIAPKIEISKYQDIGLTMNIVSLQPEDEGLYTCTAICGTETLSKSIYIKPYRGITWVDAAPEQQAMKGTNYKLKCKVEADPAPTINWFNEKFESIQTGGRYVVEPEGLLIQNVEESDDGTYKCRAAIIHPTISDSKSINIHFQTKACEECISNGDHYDAGVIIISLARERTMQWKSMCAQSRGRN